MATTEHQLLLRPGLTAEMLGVSRRTLDRMVEDKVLRPVKLRANGHRRFRQADIVRLAQPPEEDER